MPRPRTIDSQTILETAWRLICANGPSKTGFAEISAATGLSPATLVQRFGSKALLHQAALLRGWEQLREQLAQLDASVPSNKAGALSLLLALTPDAAPGNDLGLFDQGLLCLRLELGDAEIRKAGAQWLAMLAAALDRRCGPGYGPFLVAQWQGATLCWAFSADRPLRVHVEEMLSTAMAAISRTC